MRGNMKSTWTEDEDNTLRTMTQSLGLKQWSLIAQSLPGRTGKQVRLLTPSVAWWVGLGSSNTNEMNKPEPLTD